MHGLLQDLRFAVRGLVRRPGFTAVAALTLALGIGANTTIFSLVDGILLRPLPYREAERIVEIWNRWEGSPQSELAGPEFLAYRHLSRSFEAMAAFGFGTINLTGGGEPERLDSVWASSEIFAVLGVEPARGRFFTPQEDLPGGEDVVVLSHELWQRRFAADPDIVGSTVRLDGVAVTVVGIQPPETRLPSDLRRGTRTDVWLPLRLEPDDQTWSMHYLLALGRLKPAVTRQSAQADLALAVERIRESSLADEDDAVHDPAFGVSLWPVLDQIVGPVQPTLWILLAAAGVVLAIACANVANLLLVRGESRRQEIALRAAVGASRLQLVRQLLLESLLLAAVGGVVGGLLAAWGHGLLLAVLPGDVPRLSEVSLDTDVLLFALLVSLATGILFGLAPALQVSGADLYASLRDGGRQAGHGRGRGLLRSGLVVAEVALAAVLVICAGLLVRSFWKLRQVDPGYRIEDVLTLRLELPAASYPDGSDVAAFFGRLRQGLAALPGVEAVGAVSHVPLATGRGDWNFYPEDRVIAPGERSPRGAWQVVSPGYFETLGIAIHAGRSFTDRDAAGAPPVVVVNRSLARTYWPGRSPVGVRVRLGGNDDNPLATIVGVVADIRFYGLDREPVNEIYIPHAQAPEVMGRGPVRSLSLLLRAAVVPEDLVRSVRAEVAALDADLPVAEVRTMGEIRSGSLALSRVSMVLLSGFAALALALGAVGIFGVISHLVVRRTREIGIRMALGARRGNVVGLVVGAGIRLALLGLAVGLAAAAAAARLLESLLYGVAPADPATFAAVASTLALVALLASWVPARRAARIDPVVALRLE